MSKHRWSEQVIESINLSEDEKRKMIYYLECEDYINERFAIENLVKIILKYSGEIDEHEK